MGVFGFAFGAYTDLFLAALGGAVGLVWEGVLGAEGWGEFGGGVGHNLRILLICYMSFEGKSIYIVAHGMIAKTIFNQYPITSIISHFNKPTPLK